jgi:hypothetical protein
MDKSTADFVARYIPRYAGHAEWNAISDDVRRAVLLAAPTLGVAKKLLPHLAAFAVWASSEGATTLRESISDPDWQERYIAVGMPGAQESTRATRRAALRRVARRVNQSGPPAPQALPYRILKPPYRSWETTRFTDLAELQPTASRRRSLGAVLALGLGAGLDGRDMAWVRGNDVNAAGGCLTVTVCGVRGRGRSLS